MIKGLSPYIGKAACHITAVTCVWSQPIHTGHPHRSARTERVVSATAVRYAPDIKGGKLEAVSSRGRPGDLETVWHLGGGSEVGHNWETACVCTVRRWGGGSVGGGSGGREWSMGSEKEGGGEWGE